MANVVATDEIKNLIHSAMEKTGGNMSQAARLIDSPELPMTRERLKDFIHNNQDLKDRWASGKVEPPSVATTIHRPTPPPVADVEAGELMSEEDIALALAKEDAALRQGLEAMGVSGKSLQFAVALQQFHNKHFTKAVEMIGGGVSKLYLDLLAEIEQITKRLNSDEKLEPHEEMMLRQDRAQLIEAAGRTFDRANKAAMTQAIIKHKLQNKEPGGKKKKPGYLAIQSKGPVQIVHHEGESE